MMLTLNRRRGAVAIALAVTVLVAGCAGASQEPAPSPASSSPLAVDGKPNTVVAQCAPGAATGFVAPVAGGQPVEAASFGTGKLAVVLSHEWAQSPCPWADVAKRV